MSDPYRSFCPTCPDGGKATTYQADRTGLAVSYICLAVAHPDETSRVFARSAARRPRRDSVDPQ